MAYVKPELVVTFDILNEQPFLELVQRAVDLCATVDECVDAFDRGECPQFGTLRQASKEFREWFEQGPDGGEDDG